jgi:succinate dehydrogenase / fumarate reductase flavoprotein subunit/fumarate reductase flavoprotein subunit
MGGVTMDVACRTSLDGLFVAGEDGGGVHGANRLGGNGVADSIVFGARAGDSMAASVISRDLPRIVPTQLMDLATHWTQFLTRTDGENVFQLRAELEDLMWQKVGVVRNGRALTEAVAALSDLKARAENIATPAWNEAMNLQNLCVNAAMVARSALLRTESRGAHYREDFPKPDPAWLQNIHLTPAGDDMQLHCEPVTFTRLQPEPIQHANPLRHN